jgi:hypothetical protein
MKKKASLQISVEAIVILILAITMLGLGIAFIRNMFGKTTSQLGEIGDDIKNQRISDLKESNKRLEFPYNDIQVKRAGEKEIYFAVKNDLENGEIFDISMECTAIMGVDGDEGDIDFRIFDETPSMNKGDIEVMKSVIVVASEAVPSSYSCSIFIGDEYASENFFVTVT